jgi:cell division protein ZapA
VSDDDRVVPVVIQGQRYPIRSALDPSYVADLAAYVDEKMRTAAEAGAAQDSLRLAVLAALNIADEVFRCRDLADRQLRAVDERAREIEQLVDAALDPRGAPMRIDDGGLGDAKLET